MNQALLTADYADETDNTNIPWVLESRAAACRRAVTTSTFVVRRPGDERRPYKSPKSSGDWYKIICAFGVIRGPSISRPVRSRTFSVYSGQSVGNLPFQ